MEATHCLGGSTCVDVELSHNREFMHWDLNLLGSIYDILDWHPC